MSMIGPVQSRYREADISKHISKHMSVFSVSKSYYVVYSYFHQHGGDYVIVLSNSVSRITEKIMRRFHRNLVL